MWWIQHGHLPSGAHRHVDYDATMQSMQSLKPTRRRYVTKAASDNYGIGQTLVEWQFAQSPTCPRCEQIETADHVQRCNGHGADKVFEASLLKVQTYLTDEDTRPELQEAIVYSIQQWRKGEGIQLKSFGKDIQEAIWQQHQIGWRQFLECLPARKWKMIQMRYYREEQRMKSSQK